MAATGIPVHQEADEDFTLESLNELADAYREVEHAHFSEYLREVEHFELSSLLWRH